MSKKLLFFPLTMLLIFVFSACNNSNNNSNNTIIPTTAVSQPSLQQGSLPTNDPHQSVVPVFNKLQPVPAEQQAILAKPIEAQMAGSSLKVEAKFYTTQATPTEITAFYNGSLKDWKTDEGNVALKDSARMQWTKDNQTFQIIVSPDDTTPGVYLVMTSQVWK